MSGADSINATISMETLGSNEITLADETTKVQTDMYVLLKNNQTEIGVDSTPIGEETPETVNISVSVNDGENPVNGASVSINEISSTTGSQGGCTLNNVPIGAQTIIVTASGYENYSETINVSNENITFEIKLNKKGE